MQHEPGQPPAPAALGKRLAAGSLQVKAGISRGVPLIFPSSSPCASLLLPGEFLPGEFTAVTSWTPANGADVLSHHDVTEWMPQTAA